MHCLVKYIVAGILGRSAAATYSDSSTGGLASNVYDDDALFSGPNFKSTPIFNASTPVYNDTSLESLKAWPPLPASFAIPSIPEARILIAEVPNTRQNGTKEELAALQSFITWTKQQLDPFQWPFNPIELQAYELHERLYFKILPPTGGGKTFKYPDWGVKILDHYLAIMSRFGTRGTFVSVWLDICHCNIAKFFLVPDYYQPKTGISPFSVPQTLPAITPIVGLQDGMLELTSRRQPFTPDEKHTFAQVVLDIQDTLEHEYPGDTQMPAECTRSVPDLSWSFHFKSAVLVAHPRIKYREVIVALGTVARYGAFYQAIDKSHIWIAGQDYGEMYFTQDSGQLSSGNLPSVSNSSEASSEALVATTKVKRGVNDALRI